MQQFLSSLPWYAWIAIVAIVMSGISGIVRSTQKHQQRMAKIGLGMNPDGGGDDEG